MTALGDELARVLTEQGHRLTRPRRAVLRVIAESTESLSPAEIHGRARKFYRRTGLVTVYRTLDVLEACGAVRRLHVSDGAHKYATAHAAHGHHVVCDLCHQTVEFAECDLEALTRAVQRHTGFAIAGHRLELYGLCPECQASG